MMVIKILGLLGLLLDQAGLAAPSAHAHTHAHAHAHTYTHGAHMQTYTHIHSAITYAAHTHNT